jgi:hypothetical protein
MEPAMRLNEIRAEVERRPFRPFRICMSDGSEHAVSNPNLVFLTKHTVILGILEKGEELPEETLSCDTLHITRVETVS